jgi:hypothetical protein
MTKLHNYTQYFHIPKYVSKYECDFTFKQTFDLSSFECNAIFKLNPRKTLKLKKLN